MEGDSPYREAMSAGRDTRVDSLEAAAVWET
jgi:hypothetical protein